MISRLAEVHPKAQIGQNVEIGPFTFIDEGVTIGDQVKIGPHVTIFSGARIGHQTQIFPGAVIAAAPQDLKFEGEKSTVTIGEQVIIREHVTINRGTALDRGDTMVGDKSVLMAYVHIAHDCVIGKQVILANNIQMGGHVHIHDHAFLGGSSAIHQFVKIGQHVMISGGSLVKKDVPPFITAAGEPLAYAGINSTGLERKNFQASDIADIHEAYRTIYQSGMNVTEAVSSLKKSNPLATAIIEFIQSSERV